jgi:hypothetical protein
MIIVSDALRFSSLFSSNVNLFNCRRQDIDARHFSALLDFQCVLFVSHRWSTPTVPDENNMQLNQVVSVVKETFDHATNPDKSLSSLASGWRTVNGTVKSRMTLVSWARTAGSFDAFIDGLGVWFDHCVLPQPPRSARDDAIFHAALEELHRVIACSTVLVMDDAPDYYCRAWCVLEDTLAHATSNAVGRLAVGNAEFSLRNNAASLHAELATGQLRATNGADLVRVARVARRAEMASETAHLSIVLSLSLALSVIFRRLGMVSWGSLALALALWVAIGLVARLARRISAVAPLYNLMLTLAITATLSMCFTGPNDVAVHAIVIAPLIELSMCMSHAHNSPMPAAVYSPLLRLLSPALSAPIVDQLVVLFGALWLLADALIPDGVLSAATLRAGDPWAWCSLLIFCVAWHSVLLQCVTLQISMRRISQSSAPIACKSAVVREWYRWRIVAFVALSTTVLCGAGVAGIGLHTALRVSAIVTLILVSVIARSSSIFKVVQ